MKKMIKLSAVFIIVMGTAAFAFGNGLSNGDQLGEKPGTSRENFPQQAFSSIESLTEKSYEDMIFIRRVKGERVLVYSSEDLDRMFRVVIRGANQKILYQGEVDLSRGKLFNFSRVIGDEVQLTVYDGNSFIRNKTISID